MEGVSFSPLVEQVQNKGKKSLHVEGSSGGQEVDFILIQDDDTDLGSQSSKLKEIIREQKDGIHHLSLNFERAKWIINYL